MKRIRGDDSAFVMASAARSLLGLPRQALQHRLDKGHPIPPEAIAGFAYRGISLGLPGWVEKLTWKTFVKAFVHDPARQTVRGWNMRLMQNGLTGPVEPETKNGTPIVFGHFAVTFNSGLWLDYGAGHQPWHPLACMIDPLVSLSADDPEVLLGVSMLALGTRRLSTPTYFCLERMGAVQTIEQPVVWRADFRRPSP